jgi:hypothetical protein
MDLGVIITCVRVGFVTPVLDKNTAGLQIPTDITCLRRTRDITPELDKHMICEEKARSFSWCDYRKEIRFETKAKQKSRNWTNFLTTPTLDGKLADALLFETQNGLVV